MVPPFSISGIVRFFKMNIFRLKNRLSQYQHVISEWVFFSKTGVFSMRLFFNLFSSKLPDFLLETKRFARIKDSSGSSEICDLAETIIKKFFLHFSFFENIFNRKPFKKRKMVFFAVSSWGKWCSSLMPLGYFLALWNWWNSNNSILFNIWKILLFWTLSNAPTWALPGLLMGLAMWLWKPFV